MITWCCLGGGGAASCCMYIKTASVINLLIYCPLPHRCTYVLPPPQGALLAFECLSEKLGKLFEPYIIYILPLLLACFGDVVPAVRQATEEAARMIMGQLTASGKGGGGLVWTVDDGTRLGRGY